MKQRASFGPGSRAGKPGGPGRLAALAAGLTALLVVVALASRGHDTPVGRGGTDRGPSQFLADIVFTLFLLGMLATAFLLVYIRSWKRAEVHRRQRSLRAVLFPLVYLGLFTTFVVIAAGRIDDKGRKPNQGPLASLRQQQQPPGRKSPRHARTPHFEWLLAGGIAALGAAAVVVPLMRRRLAVRRYLREQRIADALVQVVDDSLEDLYAEQDPRRAVIAAYARMERTLESEGLGRHSAEAPLEYLRRVLADVRANSRSAFALTELYGRAKFSRHRVDAEMKEEAIAALVALRRDLRRPLRETGGERFGLAGGRRRCGHRRPECDQPRESLPRRRHLRTRPRGTGAARARADRAVRPGGRPIELRRGAAARAPGARAASRARTP